MVHTGVAWPYSACRSGSGLNEGLGVSARRVFGLGMFIVRDT